VIVFLSWNTGIIPIDGQHDSLRYLEMADAQFHGKWLGPYNHMTLIRSPVYSGLLSINRLMNWPLARTQTCLYLLSVALLAAALRKMDMPDVRIAAGFILSACHPAMLISCRFVATEAAYTAAVTAALAGAIGVLGSLKKGGQLAWVFWLTTLSHSIASAWRMRDESAWMIPAAMVFVGYLLIPRPAARWKSFGLRFFCVAIPVLSVYSFTVWIQQQNMKHYGVAVVSEMTEPGFKSAMSRLTRLDGDSHHPYVPISRKAMVDAERISPHFQILYPCLSHQLNGSGWSQFGCSWMGVCDELAGGWAVWAVRDVANSAGVHADAVTAAAFYADLAKEIETGCRNGSAACTTNPTGNMLAPPLQWIDIPRIVYSAIRVGWMTLWMGDLPEAYRQIADQRPAVELAAKYISVTGRIDEQGSRVTVTIHGILFWLYRVLHVIGGAGLVIIAAIRFAEWKRCRFSDVKAWLHPVWVLTGVLILSRLAIVSYIDAMSFWAQSRYMMAIYPAFMMLLCLSFPGWRFPRRRGWRAAPED
jgi:hypothetical protein